MSQDINVGVLAEQINSKADIDLRNIDTTKCDMVIEYQEPTAENNYTWYRLYASGWIEQGGFVRKNSMDANNYTAIFPIAMQNLNFTVTMAHLDGSFNSYELLCINRDTTYITLGMTGSSWQGASWQVSGKVDPAVMLNHEILPSKAKNEEFEHRVIDFQKPTAENNYTWYRKYADGWVEIGGVKAGTYTCRDNVTINLPITMADTHYECQLTSNIYGDSWTTLMVKSKAIANFVAYVWGPGSSDKLSGIHWRVEGMYAIEE